MAPDFLGAVCSWVGAVMNLDRGFAIVSHVTLSNSIWAGCNLTARHFRAGFFPCYPSIE
jgi:hypothetical protein